MCAYKFRIPPRGGAQTADARLAPPRLSVAADRWKRLDRVSLQTVSQRPCARAHACPCTLVRLSAISCIHVSRRASRIIEKIRRRYSEGRFQGAHHFVDCETVKGARETNEDDAAGDIGSRRELPRPTVHRVSSYLHFALIFIRYF